MRQGLEAVGISIETTVCLVTQMGDLESIVPPDVHVVRVAPGERFDDSVTLVLLDARTCPPHLLLTTRASLPRIPALIVAETEDDALRAAVGADDIITPPFGKTAMNRVRLLLSHGRAVTSFVTARAEVNRLLKVVHDRHRFTQAIIDGVDIGIVTTDVGGRVTFVNQFARTALQRIGNLEGEDVRQLLSLPNEPAATLAEEPERRWAHPVQVGDRNVKIDLTMSRADEGRHEHLGFFFIFHDLTREKQRETERRRFDRLAALGTMVAGFAHEIRNPMASLRSLAESLGEELAEANIDLPHVDRMLKVLERVERLVRSSLVFGRPSPPKVAQHHPRAILSAAVSSMHARTQGLGGELVIEADPGLPEVIVDDGQLSQVLVIFLNNALDATGAVERVTLRATYPRPRETASDFAHVRFEVSDDGPGIPPENRERIFDPFFTTAASGTGLGLAIAQQLATENGARIELQSPPGGRTTFSVLVPVAADVPPRSR